MRRWSMLMAAPLLVTLAGCQRTMVETGLPPAEGPPLRMTVMGFASGLIIPRAIHVARACRGPVSRMQMEQTLGNFAVQTVTAGILSPRTVTVVCAHPTLVRPAESSVVGGARTLDRRWERRRSPEMDGPYFDLRHPREHRRHFRHQ